MKTKKKLLIALLSTTVMVAGAAGFAACSTTEPEKGDAGKSAYELYVDAENAAGRTPMTQAEWLLSLVGQTGQDGKSAYELYAEAETAAGRTPKSAEEWLLSLVGKDGKGVKSVALSEDKLGLVITYTDNTTQTVLLPEEMTHVHTYDETYSVVLPATTENQGLAYVTCTSDTCDHKELVVLPKLVVPNGDGSETNPFVIGKDLKVGDKAAYKLTVSGEDYSWWGYVWDANISLVGSGSADEEILYQVTIDDENVSYDQSGSAVSSFGLLVGEENSVVSFDVDAPDYEEAGEYTFNVTVERLAPPAAGSLYKPVALEEGKTVQLQAEANEFVYFVFDLSTSDTSLKYAAQFDDSNMELYWLGSDINGDRCDQLVDGESKSMGYWNTYYYKAKAKDGKISLKLEITYDPGEKLNPIEVDLGTSKTAEFMKWYAVTVTDAGKYTIVASADGEEQNVGYNFYTESEYENNGYGSSVDSGKYVFDAQAGKTYYIQASSAFDFQVRAYNEATDLGCSVAVPKTITDGNVNLTTEENYFVYTAASGGTFYVAGANVQFNVYNNASYLNYGKTGEKDNERLFYYLDNELAVEVEEDDVLYISANAAGTSATMIVGISTAETPAAVAYTLKLIDDEGNALPAGVKVTATKGETEVDGTTDADGKITLNLVPDNYAITVDFGTVTGYTYVKQVTTAKCYGASETTVTIAKNHTFTVTVKHKGTAVSGLTVSLDNNITAVTNEQGVATFSVPDSYYTVSIINAADAEDPYVISGKLSLSGGAYGVRDGELNVMLDSELIKYNSLVVPEDGVVEVSALTGYSFTTATGGCKVTVTNGHIEAFNLGGMDIIADGVVKMPGGTTTEYDCLLGWGGETVKLAIVPDEGKTATVTIEFTDPWAGY